MIDVARDPRWEEYQKDTGRSLVNSAFCVASVKGYQGKDLKDDDTIAACLKHYVGYSESLAGIDYAYTDISDRTVWKFVTTL